MDVQNVFLIISDARDSGRVERLEVHPRFGDREATDVEMSTGNSDGLVDTICA